MTSIIDLQSHLLILYELLNWMFFVVPYGTWKLITIIRDIKEEKKSKMHKPGPLLLLSLHAEIAKIPSKCARESSIDSRFFTLFIKFIRNFSKYRLFFVGLIHSSINWANIGPIFLRFTRLVHVESMFCSGSWLNFPLLGRQTSCVKHISFIHFDKFSTVLVDPLNLKQDTIDIISWDNSI